MTLHARRLAGMAAIVTLAVGVAHLHGQAPAFPVTVGKAFRFERVADGVYFATATGSMVTGGNNVAIVGSRDVLVVDTGTTPAAARAFLDDLKLVTTRPVRFVLQVGSGTSPDVIGRVLADQLAAGPRAVAARTRQVQGAEAKKAAARKQAMDEAFEPGELERLTTGVSNGGYHYLGAAKILAPIGRAFAGAVIDLQAID